MKMYINNEISLRPLVSDDANHLFELVNKNRDRLRQWLPWLDKNKSISDSKKFIELCINDYETKKGLCLAIEFHNKLIGLISLQNISSENRSAGVGYWIDQDFSGKGIIKKSVEKIIHYAQNDLALARIEIRCATENLESQRIPEKLNFEFEGIARKCEWLYDHHVDHKVYSLINPEV